jgi:hypothetical protein
LNSKKLKIETKIPKNTSGFIESNSVKFFSNLVRLVFFSVITTSAKKEKEKRPPGPLRPTRPKGENITFLPPSPFLSPADRPL